MKILIYVAGGGAAGAMSRYALAKYIQSATPSIMPYGTIVVNLVGCLIIGGLWAWIQRFSISPAMIALVFTGFVASFTTFSTFSLDTLGLIRSNHVGLALANVALSNIGGVGAVFIGYLAVKSIVGVAATPGL